ncbi:MAG: glucose-1-phosphate adenylyltransferase [Bacteroidetes bacterium]|nr:MAG: glucose-1-phosphate adenylyltransferase [Bacteroidota bacterium]
MRKLTDRVAAIILGGGRGTRLSPLTDYRAKPALPLAGKYRLIDIPVSNCINSDVHKIFVLTQFNSASLNQHISATYRFSPFSKGFVYVLAASQSLANPEWFQGTADAVRKSRPAIDPWKVDDYLILSGDHLYRMDYRLFLQHHKDTNADITISVIPVNEHFAPGFGLMKIDGRGKVIDFKEKPSGDALHGMRVDTTALGLNSYEANLAPYIASMGIYLFKRDVLFNLLDREPFFNDFGKDIIPAAIKELNVQAYLFKGYWEDIGTIPGFYNANLKLVKQPNPEFSFFDVEFPIYTRPRFLPPSKILKSDITDTMVCDGCIIKSARCLNSVIGIRSRLDEGTVLENTLLMGLDFYQSNEEREEDLRAGRTPMGIGEGTFIRNAIIDKNARIGKNVKIMNKDNLDEFTDEKNRYVIRSGITIVMKDAVLPDGTEI